MLNREQSGWVISLQHRRLGGHLDRLESSRNRSCVNGVVGQISRIVTFSAGHCFTLSTFYFFKQNVTGGHRINFQKFP